MNVVTSCGLDRSSGGLFFAVSSLCKALHAAGTKVSVFGPEGPFTNEDRSVWNPVQVSAYRSYGPLRMSRRLRRMFDRADASLIHQHGIWLDDQWAGFQWQKKTGRPVVVSPHGMLDPWAVQHSVWKKKLAGALFANASLRSAACIHALCDAEAESIRAYGIATPVAVIPNGIDLPVCDARTKADGTKKLLYLGRIHPKKGLCELIKAWEQYQPSGWKLLVAGWDDGGYEAGLRKMAEEVGDSISFLGSRFGEAKDQLFRSVDAFILPSFSEGLPMSVLEAWAYRLPVIMSDFCNLPQGFECGAALRIEPSTDSILTGLSQLVTMNEADLLNMGECGRMLVEQKFTWEQVAADMASVYAWCLGGERPACIRDV